MTTLLKPTLFMLASTLSLSISAVIAKFLTTQFSLAILVLLRLLIPAVIMFIMMSLTQIRLPDKTLAKSILIRALCIAGCQLCFITSLSMLTLVESVVLFSTGPLFIPVLEKLIFGVKVKGATKIGLVVTFAGVLLLAGDVTGITLKPELLIGLGAGLFNAGSQLSLYRSTKGNLSPVAINAWSFLLSSFFVLPVLAWFGISSSDMQIMLQPELNLIIWSAVLVLAFTIVSNQIYRSKAYKLVDSGSQLAPLIYTNLIFSVIWQITLFDEILPAQKMVGVALIIVASLIPTLISFFKSIQLKFRLVT